MHVYYKKCSDTYVLRTISTEDNAGDEFEWSFS